MSSLWRPLQRSQRSHKIRSRQCSQVAMQHLQEDVQEQCQDVEPRQTSSRESQKPRVFIVSKEISPKAKSSDAHQSRS